MNPTKTPWYNNASLHSYNDEKKEGMVTDPELLYNLYIITRWIGKKKFVWNLTFVPVGPLSALLVTAVTV